MKIAIAGCTGKMGLALLKAARDHAGVELVAGSAHDVSAATERLVREGLSGLNIPIVSDAETLFAKAAAVIDFTRPEHSLHLAEEAAKTGKALVCGTTGFTDAQMASLKTYAKKAPILWSANTSLGVNLLEQLVEQAAKRLGDAWDIEIVEMHHKHKQDAPSGTALMLGRAAASGRGVALGDVAVKSREGMIGARKTGTIGFATLRGGDVVGEHTVMFAGDAERVELTHKATSRAVFANGAIAAALWISGKKPGFYSMKDVIGG